MNILELYIPRPYKQKGNNPMCLFKKKKSPQDRKLFLKLQSYRQHTLGDFTATGLGIKT